MKNTLIAEVNLYGKILKFSSRVGFKLMNSEKTPETGKWIKNEILRMGPTFIKLGQVVSSRPDMFPEYIVKELDELQDNVPPFPFNDVSNIFYNDFDRSVHDVFEYIDVEPIAAASIGQVHLGTLKSNTNNKVVMKVLRPNIKKDILSEIECIANIFRLLKGMNIRKINDLYLIINECYKNILKETDFTNEMHNIYNFSSAFYNNDFVQIPKVYSKLTSKNIIIMEYLPGVKINNIEKLQNYDIDTVKLSKSLMGSFIKMILVNGYLHSDPHPGNISVSRKGTIILYDFGIVEKYEDDFIDVLRELCGAFVERNVENIMNILLKHEILYALDSNAKSVGDLTDNEYVILFKLVTNVIQYIIDLDFQNLMDRFEKDSYIDARNIPFILNSNMVLMFKTMSTLEGVCKNLNPAFSYYDLVMDLVNDLFGADVLFERAMKDIESLIENRGAVKGFNNNTLSTEKLNNAQISRLEENIDKNNKVIAIMSGVSLLMVSFIL
jgi:predicted unusual protein kinase regulating ubiquinone biosynthesis (AarF/ABC1/UbiB family)